MAKPRIGIIHYASPPVIGGVETVMENHAMLFADAGYPVRLIVGVGSQQDKRVPVTVIPELSSTFKENTVVQRQLRAGRVTKRFAAYKDKIKRHLARALGTVDIAIVHNVLSMHFNIAFSAALVELIKERRGSLRVINWCHDHTFIDEAYRFVKPDMYPWNVIGEFLEGVDYVTISPDRQAKLAGVYGVPPDTATVVQNGIHFNDFLQLDVRSAEIIQKYRLLDSNCILFAPSRIVPRKNLELSIRVTAVLKKTYHRSTRLIITGPPDPHNPESMKYYRSLHRLARELHCTRNIIFLYDHLVKRKFRLNVNKLIIRDLYMLSDCLLFPSFMEGFGIPILEAGMLKRPVVCSNIAPHVTIGGDNVLKIDPYGDPETIAHDIVVYLHRDITRPLFKRVKTQYTWERIFADKIEPLIQKRKGRLIR